MTESLFKELPNEINLSSSHLLYYIDLTLKKKKLERELFFCGEGSVRVGPKKSKVNLKAKFDISKGEWIFGEYEVKGLFIDEKFKQYKDQIQIEAKNQSKIVHTKSSYLEPLSLIFVSLYNFKSQNVNFETNLLMGGKLRPASYRNNNLFSKESQWAKFCVDKKDINILISLFKVKIKIELKA